MIFNFKSIKTYFPYFAIGITSFLLITILHYFGSFSSVELKLYDFRENLVNNNGENKSLYNIITMPRLTFVT